MATKAAGRNSTGNTAIDYNDSRTAAADNAVLLGSGARMETSSTQHITDQSQKTDNSVVNITTSDAEVLQASLAANASVTDTAFGFGSEAVGATTKALDSSLGFGSESLGFGSEVLGVLADFGKNVIAGANERTDAAVSAVERLAFIPSERNAEPPVPLNKNWIVAAVAILAALLLLNHRKG